MGEAIFVGTIIPLFFLAIILKGEQRLLILFFIWGLIAFAISLTLNNALVRHFQINTQQLSTTWAPIIEEFTKALPLGYFLFKSEKKIPIVYFGIAAGIGFSIQENYVYLLGHMHESGSPVPFIITRSVTTCLIHGTTTGIVGFGLSIARQLNGIIWPLLFGLYTVAVTIHALYNLYIYSSYQSIGLFMPLFLYLIGFAVLNIKEDKGREKD